MSADASKLAIVAEVQSQGKTTTVSTTFSAINPEISDKDLVACGNALGSLCRVEPDYFKRVDTTIFAPDQFDEDGGGD